MRNIHRVLSALLKASYEIANGVSYEFLVVLDRSTIHGPRPWTASDRMQGQITDPI